MRQIGLTRAGLTGQGGGVESEATRRMEPPQQPGTAGVPAGGGGLQPPAELLPSISLATVGGGAAGAAAASAAALPPAPPLVSKSAEPDSKLLPSDVFALLAPATSSLEPATLSLEDFTKLFERLDLQLSEARKEQLFAYMDITGRQPARAGGCACDSRCEPTLAFCVSCAVALCRRPSRPQATGASTRRSSRTAGTFSSRRPSRRRPSRLASRTRASRSRCSR